MPKTFKITTFNGIHQDQQVYSSISTSSCASHDSEGIIQSLCHQGELDKAMDMLSDMHSPPHDNTYIALLRACYRSKGISHAKRVLNLMKKHYTSVSGLVCDYLVVTLAKCLALEDAWKVFCILPRRTVFSWTAIISAYVACGQAEEALCMRKHMHLDGVEPNSYTFVSFVKACGISRDLEQGKELHDEIRRKGLASDVFVGSTLVSMYGKCGAVTEAEVVFSSLCQRNIVSWNAMLATYVEQGEGEKTLSLFRQMQEDDVGIDRHTLLFSLQACMALSGDGKFIAVDRRRYIHMILELAHSLHADAKRSGFSSDVFVGSTLVSIYGRLGAISEAVHVFCALSKRNVVSWTAIISAYVEVNQAEKALQLFWQMQIEVVSPDKLAAVAVFQACCSLAENSEIIINSRPNKGIALEIGQALRDDTCTKDFSSDVFLNSSLLNMYSKCGAIMEAECMFGSLSQPNIVLWSTMLTLYVEQEQGEKALQLYMKMQEERVDPDEQTIVCALRAVCILAESEEALVGERWPIKVISLEIGCGLHADARRKGLVSDVFVCNTLVSMYGKCGALVEAEQVFGAMSDRNVISWTAMISAYHEHGQGDKALQLYAQMQHESVHADQLTYMIALQACVVLTEKEEASSALKEISYKIIALEIGQLLHEDVKMKGFGSDAFIGTALLNMYGKCGDIIGAEKIFETLVTHDVVSWSAMLSAYIDQNEGQKALQVYRQMQEERLCIDQLTSIIALQACSIIAEGDEMPVSTGMSRKTFALEIGRALHADARRKGFASDLYVSNTILNMYGKCGAVLEAEHVFGLASERNTVSWNTMITVYAEQGEEEKALRLFEEMQNQCVDYDDVTLISVLKACSLIGSSNICNELHFDIICAGYELVPSVAASIIHVYGSCARMVDAHAFFDELIQPHLASWNACIIGHAGEGNGVESLYTFENLKLEAIKPDGVTFTSAISACTHTGFVFEGLEYFASMSQDYGILPEVKHYGAIIDLLARAGSFKQVENMLAKMTVKADQIIWLCLLGACHTHGNVELARHAFEHAVNLEPKHAAAYVMMSNVYGKGGMQIEKSLEVWLNSD